MPHITTAANIRKMDANMAAAESHNFHGAWRTEISHTDQAVRRGITRANDKSQKNIIISHLKDPVTMILTLYEHLTAQNQCLQKKTSRVWYDPSQCNITRL